MTRSCKAQAATNTTRNGSTLRFETQTNALAHACIRMHARMTHRQIKRGTRDEGEFESAIKKKKKKKKLGFVRVSPLSPFRVLQSTVPFFLFFFFSFLLQLLLKKNPSLPFR